MVDAPTSLSPSTSLRSTAGWRARRGWGDAPHRRGRRRPCGGAATNAVGGAARRTASAGHRRRLAGYAARHWLPGAVSQDAVAHASVSAADSEDHLRTIVDPIAPKTDADWPLTALLCAVCTERRAVTHTAAGALHTRPAISAPCPPTGPHAGAEHGARVRAGCTVRVGADDRALAGSAALAALAPLPQPAPRSPTDAAAHCGAAAFASTDRAPLHARRPSGDGPTRAVHSWRQQHRWCRPHGLPWRLRESKLTAAGYAGMMR